MTSANMVSVVVLNVVAPLKEETMQIFFERVILLRKLPLLPGTIL
jgi:hypothetical protein